MKRPKPHKCLSCTKFFLPDHRNGWHQEYCSEEACQRESHRAAQAKYRASPKGRSSTTKPDEVKRMQEWRRRQKEAPAAEAVVLRDDCKSEDVAREDDGGCLGVLRDDCLEQNPLIIGLISQVSGVLRDDIASAVKRLHSRGQMILGKGPGIVNQN